MATIKKRTVNGKVTYQAEVYVGRDAEGIKIRKYITRQRRKDCVNAARKLEQEVRDGKYLDIDNMKVIVWMERWLERNKSRLAPSTYQSYDIYVQKHFKPFWGVKKLSQVNHIHLQEYMSQKLEQYSVSYVRKHLFVMREMLEDAMPGNNPMRHVDLPSPVKFKSHIITEEEFKTIHDSMKGTKDEIIILLSAWCGLRRGEIFALKWNDIDWKLGRIRVDESRSISEDGYIDKRPKSDNSNRSVSASQYLMDLLEQHRKDYGMVTQRIFDLRPDHYSSYFREKMDAIGYNNIRFHDLRHFHASWLYHQGVPDQYAAQRLGHDINVLKGIYQHMRSDEIDKLDQKIRKMK